MLASVSKLTLDFSHSSQHRAAAVLITILEPSTDIYGVALVLQFVFGNARWKIIS